MDYTADQYKEWFNGTDKYNCQTCYHKRTCDNVGDVSNCCAYWWSPESKIVGLAYDNEKVDNLPLFEKILTP